LLSPKLKDDADLAPLKSGSAWNSARSKYAICWNVDRSKLIRVFRSGRPAFPKVAPVKRTARENSASSKTPPPERR